MVEHDACQAFCLRVLLTWVIRGQKGVASLQACEFSMLEAWARGWQDVPELLISAQISVEGEPSQRDDHLHVV